MQQPTFFNVSRSSKRTHRSFGLRIAIMTIALMLLWGPDVWAQSKDDEPFLLSVAKFTTGILSAYALHEVGHWAAAELTGTDIDFGAGRYNQPIGFTEHAENDTDGMIVHGSGLVTQVLVSEVILQSNSIDKNDSLARGMMFWNIFNPIVYALDYWLLRRTNKENDTSYQGDIEGFENYSSQGSANVFAGVMVMAAAFQGYRYAKTQDWAPDWIKSEAVQFTCQPTAGLGAALSIHVKF